MQHIDLPDSLYNVLDFADFDILPVKSHDVRVRNLPSSSNTLEMPREQFDTLQGLIKLYQTMHRMIEHYTKISSPSLVNFLIQGILSSDFHHKMPPLFSHFPQLALAYQKTIASATPSLTQRQHLVRLRPKFLMGILEAYFEQDFVISTASLSQEKFANASFFDGSTEFKIEVTIDNVLLAIGQGYEFLPLKITVAGTYSMIDGYVFDTKNWQVKPDFKRYFDEILFENKPMYLAKIVSQSRTWKSLEDFTTCLINIAEQFRQAEVQRLKGLPKSLPHQ